MRHTASRQPYDVSRPKNSRHPITTPDPQNDYFNLPLYSCKPTSATIEKRGITGPHSTLYREVTQAPIETARQNPLPALPTNDTGPRNHSEPTNTTTKNLFPRLPLPTETHYPLEISHTRKQVGKMRQRDNGDATKAPSKTACLHLLHEPLPRPCMSTSGNHRELPKLTRLQPNDSGATKTTRKNGPP